MLKLANVPVEWLILQPNSIVSVLHLISTLTLRTTKHEHSQMQ